MAAHVLEGAQLAVVAVNDQHGIRAAAVLEVITWFGDVVDRAGELPHLRPHLFDLEPGEVRGVVTLSGHKGGALRRRSDRVLAPGVGRVADNAVDWCCPRHDRPPEFGCSRL